MTQLLAVPLTLLLILPLFVPSALAQADIEEFTDQSLQASVTPPQDPSQQDRPLFTQAELDQMLAPIALYPDALLSQILMASTYPLEVIEAARWSKAHTEMEGEQAVEAVSEFSWDPSVKALVAFPQILAVMDEKLTWMEQLGDAFLSQREQVMETIQGLRQKAADAGNLESDDHQRVSYTGSTIIITSVDPSFIYVPYYNPMVIYGTWWWPTYTPVYWAPWHGYYVDSGFYAGFTWGLGTHIASRWFWSGFNWPSYQIFVRGNHVWRHNSLHRRGVPYQNRSLHREFGRTNAYSGGREYFSSGSQEHFRGAEAPHIGGYSGFERAPDMRLGSHNRHRQRDAARLDMPGSRNHIPMPSEFGRRHVSPSHSPKGIAPRSAQRPRHTPSSSFGRQQAPAGGFSGSSGFSGARGFSERSGGPGNGGFRAGSQFRGGGGMHSGGGFRGGGGGMHKGGGSSNRGGGGHRR